MSWIVQSLWNNRERIREKSRKVSAISYTYPFMYESDVEFEDERGEYNASFVESDEFNDLLVVEKAVEELTDLGLLSEKDLEVLYSSGEGAYTNENKHRKVDSKQYSSVCERIAYYLGGYFTDEGYIHYLATKYGLTLEQVETLRAYMKSRFKHKILNKSYRIENNNEKFRTVSAEV